MFINNFSSELYFAICSSCSTKITQINQTELKSNQVVIIFVQIMMSASLSQTKEFSFSVLFLTDCISNLKILFSGKIFFKDFSICSVQTHIFNKFFELQLSQLFFKSSL